MKDVIKREGADAVVRVYSNSLHKFTMVSLWNCEETAVDPRLLPEHAEIFLSSTAELDILLVTQQIEFSIWQNKICRLLAIYRYY